MYRPINEPNYVARTTTIPLYVNFWTFLFTILSVGAVLAAFVLKVLPEGIITTAVGIAGIAIFAILFFVLMCKTLKRRYHYYEFYDNYVIEKEGIIRKYSKKFIFPKIVTITTNKHILNWGDVTINVAGTTGDKTYPNIARPNVLRDFLEYHMLNAAAIENISNNPYLASSDAVPVADMQ